MQEQYSQMRIRAFGKKMTTYKWNFLAPMLLYIAITVNGCAISKKNKCKECPEFTKSIVQEEICLQVATVNYPFI